MVDVVVEKMSQIQKFYGFDGWLINIENSLEPENVEKMKEFLKKLKKFGVVIWYDAVTVKGELKWQDSLTKLNKPFFDVSSGIFLNYTWNEEKLAATRLMAYESQTDKDRSLSVYAGVDVFGRGAFGGGEMKSFLATAEARKNGLNAALFAPGWLVEKDKSEKEAEEFWNSIVMTLPDPDWQPEYDVINERFEDLDVVPEFCQKDENNTCFFASLRFGYMGLPKTFEVLVGDKKCVYSTLRDAIPVTIRQKNKNYLTFGDSGKKNSISIQVNVSMGKYSEWKMFLLEIE